MKNGIGLSWEQQAELNNFFENSEQIKQLTEGELVLVKKEEMELFIQLRTLLDQDSNIILPPTFDPVDFMGNGWSAEHYNHTDLPKQFQLVSMLQGGEKSVVGKVWHKRLLKSHTPLNADHFLYFWNNKDKIPELWKEKINGNTRFIYFNGTVLRYPSGDRFVLCLCWGGGEWDWDARWLGSDWSSYGCSVVAS